MKSYNHKCWFEKEGLGWLDCWRISWVLDGQHQKSGKKYSRKIKKTASEYTAKRFCKKWGLKFPKDE